MVEKLLSEIKLTKRDSVLKGNTKTKTKEAFCKTIPDISVVKPEKKFYSENVNPTWPNL